MFHEFSFTSQKTGFAPDLITADKHEIIVNEGKITSSSCFKLRQFNDSDNKRVVIREHNYNWLPGISKGLSVMPLHSYGTEHSALVKWDPCTTFSRHSHWGGEEIYILNGVLHDEYGTYKKGTWIRSPHLSIHTPFTSDEGATIFVKTGHMK